MYMPRIFLYVFITLSKFKWGLMAVLVNRFHKTVNKVFKSAVVIFQVILLDQLNMLTSLVRAVDSRLESPGLQPCGITVLCSEAKHFTLTMLLSTQEFLWSYIIELSCREAGWNVGELPCNLVMDWHPIHGGVITFLVASCNAETGINSGCMGHRKLRLHGPLGSNTN